MYLSKIQVLDIVNKQLPIWIKRDKIIREAFDQIVEDKYAPKVETNDRFEKLLLKLEKDAEKQDKKWEDWKAEDKKKWDEDKKKWDDWKTEDKKKWDDWKTEDKKKWDDQNKKWDEQNTKLDEQSKKWWSALKEQNDKWDDQNKKWWRTLDELKAINTKHTQSIGAIGSRWGLHSEATFRNALIGIFRDIKPEYEIMDLIEDDPEGIVFDKPSEVEIDVFMKNGKLFLMEIKASVSKGDVAIFLRKIKFYEKRHNVKVNEKIIISPMIADKAKKFAQDENIKLYSWIEEVELEE